MRKAAVLSAIAVGFAILALVRVARSEGPDCTDRADLNGDGDVNISDAVYLLRRLFVGGPPVACEKGVTITLSREAMECFPGGGAEISLTARAGRGASGPITLSAEVPAQLRVLAFPAQVDGCKPATFVLAVADGAAAGGYIAKIRAASGDATDEKVVAVTVSDGPPSDPQLARALRNGALTFLDLQHNQYAERHGLTLATAWDEYWPCPPILIVSHHVSIAGPWRMVETWHVMVPPDDWKRCFLSNEEEGIYWACEWDTNDVVREIPYEKPGLLSALAR